MAEITMNDLKETYIKLKKDVPVYTHPLKGDQGAAVWFMKKNGEIAGKLYWWITPQNPMQFTGIKNDYMIFKINDDFNNQSAPWYFIKFDKSLIDWDFSKQQLQQKQYADMSLWEKFVSDMEKRATDYTNNIKDYVQSGVKTGLAIVTGVLAVKFILIPFIQYKVLKSTARDLIKEAKR